MAERETFEVDCIVCFDRGVIHFTDLAPSKNHEPLPGVRLVPLKGQVWSRRQDRRIATPRPSRPGRRR